MKSVMQHNFSQVPRAEIPRSSFDRSHDVKTTFDAGWLYPFFTDEVIPGDTFNLRTTGFCRLSTPIYPIMDNMFLDTFYFFVPLRLIWDNFKRMMGEQDNPTDSTDYICPVTPGLATFGFPEGSLADYLGIPTNVDIEVNSFFFRAYNLIWNEWFRDQNLQDSRPVDKDDGPDNWLDYVLMRRGKRHDYFTSCLPFPQKGPEVSIPIADTAPILADGTVTTPWIVRDSTTQVAFPNANLGSNGASQLYDSVTTTNLELHPNFNLIADLSSAANVTINQLREAFQIQRMYERDARGGTRYIEMVKSHFGVSSPDARLQRPEYLGGGTSRVNITPIAQTSETATTAQGSLAAMGTVSFSGHGFTKSFTEHGVLLGLINVRADLSYQQGLHKMFTRSDRLDFYWPALSHLGEQAVYNKEIYAQGTAQDDEVFGYQERYAEYRYKPSIVTGAFRSNSTTPLDAWHLSQEFASLPTLGDAFIRDTPPISRVVAVPTEPHFIGDFYHQLRCARPMPMYGVPGMLDHF